MIFVDNCWSSVLWQRPDEAIWFLNLPDDAVFPDDDPSSGVVISPRSPPQVP